MKYLFLFLLSLLLLNTACSTRYVDVRGEKFEMISEKEERELVESARLALKTIAKKLPPQDMKTIETGEPECRFIYSDHRFGRAIIRWHFKTYEVGVDYEGQLMTRHMTSSIFTRKKRAAVVDFIRKDPMPSPKRTPRKSRRQ